MNIKPILLWQKRGLSVQDYSYWLAQNVTFYRPPIAIYRGLSDRLREIAITSTVVGSTKIVRRDPILFGSAMELH
jgi:hypothetical protein